MHVVSQVSDVPLHSLQDDSTNSPRPWTFEYYQGFFNVDTDQVGDCLVLWVCICLETAIHKVNLSWSGPVFGSVLEVLVTGYGHNQASIGWYDYEIEAQRWSWLPGKQPYFQWLYTSGMVNSWVVDSKKQACMGLFFVVAGAQQTRFDLCLVSVDLGYFGILKPCSGY